MADMPDQVVNQFHAEVEGASEAAFLLSQRCRLIVAKAEANGLLDAKLPAGSDRDVEAIRSAYDNIVKAMIALFNNSDVGKTDRTTINWQVNRGRGV